MVPLDSSGKIEQSPRKRPRFWLGPFLAGGCFALSYGITNRLISIGFIALTFQEETPAVKVFPGIELASLRNLHGGTRLELLADPASKGIAVSKSQKIPIEIGLINSRHASREQALKLESETDLNALPLNLGVPSFPSLRTFSLPSILPSVP